MSQAGDMVGEGAIKRPSFGYRQSVFSRAKSQEIYRDFQYEFGWVYADVPSWGNRTGPNLSEKLISTIQN